ncbi:hypothetical protein DPMN_176597 [Dreissena polymorpha]|uniref:Uncharacterized protein n=1 Tax=Dreissena polymorpha TaxID=45954 RepID=A0A9D4E9E0_DREPO|nr:hypothetical protein DPMN_176597 [Dreissena polymorpha]
MAGYTNHDTLEDALFSLKQFEKKSTTRYVVGNATKHFGKIELRVERQNKLLWNDCTPYMVLGRKVLFCHHGKDYHRKSKERKKKSCRS